MAWKEVEMCCCKSCKEKSHPVMSNEEIVKELESLKRIVEFFPVETYLNGERFCCDCVEEIDEKIKEYI